jgi:hypothetical protein
MIPKERVQETLDRWAISNPRQIMPRLVEGARVQKSMGLAYVIDDLQADKLLGEFPGIPYGPIFRGLRSSQNEIRRLFDGRTEIPISEAVKAGLGECLEKSILMQLAAQRCTNSFLINGSIELASDEVRVGNPHAYNVVFMGEDPYLIDAENPLVVTPEGKITHPYIAPILSIQNKFGDFEVPEIWKQGRLYSVV